MNDQSTLLTQILPAIATKGLAKRYQDRFAIKDLNLTISPGEALGILGANGAGKSTLIKLLATAEVPTRGQIYFHGDRLVANSRQIGLRKKLGYLPEQEKLDPTLSVHSYLRYFASLYQIPPTQSKIRVYEVLESVELTHKLTHLVGQLSQGEQKRLSLARAIIHEPMILLLDNPFPSLDKNSQQQLENLLATLQEAGITIVITATNLAKLVKICTTIKVIEYGYLTDSIDLRQFDLSNLKLTNLDYARAIAKFRSSQDKQNPPIAPDIYS